MSTIDRKPLPCNDPGEIGTKFAARCAFGRPGSPAHIPDDRLVTAVWAAGAMIFSGFAGLYALVITSL